jgi:hypothetical protein
VEDAKEGSHITAWPIPSEFDKSNPGVSCEGDFGDGYYG